MTDAPVTSNPEKDALELFKLRHEAASAALDLETKEIDLARRKSTTSFARVLPFPVSVDPRTACAAIDQLHEWVRFDAKAPIVLRFSSPGGYVFEGFGLYDTIRDLVKHGANIETRCVGYAASMAGVLLQAGSVRSMSPHSYLMIHEVGSDAWGKTSEIRDELDLVERLEERCMKILASRSKLTIRKIREASKRKDWWIDASEARSLGLVDVVR